MTAAGNRIWWPRHDRRGAAAVEFVLIAPILSLLVAGAVDFGGALYVKLRLDTAVSAGANFAQVNAANVSAAGAAALTANIVNIVQTSEGATYADAAVVVNNSAAGNADACYAPTGAGPTLAWGVAMTCGAAGANGALAGKFVTITVSRTYRPVFSNYGLVTDGAIRVSAVVETQ